MDSRPVDAVPPPPLGALSLTSVQPPETTTPDVFHVALPEAPVTEWVPTGSVSVNVPLCPHVGVPLAKYCVRLPDAAPPTCTAMALV